MAEARVVILGAGFGGLTAAHALRREAGDRVELLVVDRAPSFVMGLRKLWLLDGRSRADEGRRDRSSLDQAGIPFRQGTVDAIEPDARRVVVDGEAVPYDFLVVSLGAQPRPELVAGEPEGTPNLYTVEGAEEAGRRLAGMDRGRVLIAIAGVPYKCPPAPFEAAFLIDALLRRTGRRDAIEVEVLSPQPMSIPAAGPAACTAVESRLAAKGIAFRPLTTIEAVEPGRVTIAGGGAEEADLVILVPPHRPPRAVAESGLSGDGPWVKADPRTLSTEREDVYAAGDVVEMTTGGGLPFPKAGVFAEQHGEVAARNVAALVSGGTPAATFEGFGYCFLEVGDGQATRVEGNFLLQPPQVVVEDPSPEHLEAKAAFERDRLARWFPS